MLEITLTKTIELNFHVPTQLTYPVSIIQTYQQLLTERGNYLRSRHLQYLLAFSYWPPISPRKGNNLYEIRSYSLKPGTMIEWGNNWARAINYRRNNDEPFAAFFSQIGRLYNVHHIWCKLTLSILVSQSNTIDFKVF